MKVQNITLYAGATPQSAANGVNAGKEQDDRKTIFAGNMSQESTLRDRIARKKEQAQKQAMKVVGDAFAGDKAIDEDMENRRGRVQELKEEKQKLQEEASGVAERKETLRKAHEAGEVSEADYMTEKLNLAKEEQAYAQKLAENENEALQENAVIRGTRQERLKYNPVEQAWGQADAVMEAAGDEIMGMVVEDAKEKLDEENRKREEQAEEIKEEREEQREFIERQQEKKEENEIPEDVPTEEILSLSQVQEDVKQEVQNIVDKMNLLAEDIKGAVVDKTL